ncbi:uncharacterized protein ASPGLDRAFT_39025 [Aspergillus glaucus CBS 516.65]|uniref:Uncharacterized protein n=1 Tax=Aspergillus glaucus CBS 516.65 TaxID=1160497 RepID=A0A1L9V8Q3_ASPGL|nr:hypothetical protein ASPGLDRAFT_39025 [Aspergillus glaucus CBS 516.65]OJJ80326.1 hypothetical protein ASPGLDRAFT_39025 [Aspergillus glaucus CBS 516.65]
MATFDITYLVTVSLKPDEGSTLPIQDQKVVWVPPEHPEESAYSAWPERRTGTTFNQDTEDLWLFDLNVVLGSKSSPTVMTFTIGPYVFEYSWGWEFFRDIHDHSFAISDLETNNESHNIRARNQWLAIRAPKMRNPAITISAKGEGYAAVRKVGLFVRRNANALNEFICVKTSGRLTGNFIKRHEHEQWWEDSPWMHGVDVKNCAITMFPKQLYGTNGSRALYKKFVTVDDDDKDRALSESHQHWARMYRDRENTHVSPKAYMWLQDFDTNLYSTTSGEELLNWSSMKPSPEGDPDSGIKWLLGIFSSITKIVTGLVTGNLAEAIEGTFELGDKLIVENANTKGFITAVAEGMPQKMDIGLNTRNIPDLRAGDTKGEDFGFTVSK